MIYTSTSIWLGGWLSGAVLLLESSFYLGYSIRFGCPISPRPAGFQVVLVFRDVFSSLLNPLRSAFFLTLVIRGAAPIFQLAKGFRVTSIASGAPARAFLLDAHLRVYTGALFGTTT